MPTVLRVLAATLLVLFCSPEARAQSKAAIDLSVSVQGKPRIGGELTLLVSLSNTSPKAVSFPDYPSWDADGGLTLKVTQVNGPTTLARLEPEDTARRTTRRRESTAVILEAGHSIDLFRKLPTNELTKSPGDYRVVVTYQAKGFPEVSSKPFNFSISP